MAKLDEVEGRLQTAVGRTILGTLKKQVGTTGKLRRLLSCLFGIRRKAMTQGIAEIEGARIYYELEGEGPAVVFVNPGALDCRIWDPQWPAFVARHRVLRYDPRGFRGSSKPEGAISHIGDLRARLDFVGISRAHLIGSSFGGSLALDFAAAHPGLVASLVLVGAGGPQNGFPMPADLFRAFAPIAQAMREDFARGIDVWLEIDERMPRHERLRSLLREIALENESYWKIAPGWVEPLRPVRERLKDMPVPTLAVGERDHPYTLDVALLLEREMPRPACGRGRRLSPGPFGETLTFNEFVL
jgi:pimeloyl-ACP methyl ester carboxylesterase